MRLSENFTSDEFKCKHKLLSPQCEQVMPPRALIIVLQQFRNAFGKPVRINSGHRCAEYNRLIGGARSSQHILGTAADIAVDGMDPAEVQRYFLENYIRQLGIGTYDTFTHIDVRRGAARWEG